MRDIGFGLIIVVVADEVPDGVVWEKVLELAIELRGECLVMRENEGGASKPGDDVGHRERLARTRDTEKGLVLLLLKNSTSELVDRLGLISRGLVRRDQLEVGHC